MFDIMKIIFNRQNYVNNLNGLNYLNIFGEAYFGVLCLLTLKVVKSDASYHISSFTKVVNNFEMQLV